MQWCNCSAMFGSKQVVSSICISELLLVVSFRWPLKGGASHWPAKPTGLLLVAMNMSQSQLITITQCDLLLFTNDNFTTGHNHT